MITPGAIVTHRAFGTTAFVVQRLRPDGLVDIATKAADALGRVSYSGMPASPGDLTEVQPAPTFTAGATFQRDGATLTVLADNGDSIECEVGERAKPLKGGGHVRLVAGNTTTVAKGDIVLEAL